MLASAWSTLRSSPILPFFSGKPWLCGFLRPGHDCKDLSSVWALPYRAQGYFFAWSWSAFWIGASLVLAVDRKILSYSFQEAFQNMWICSGKSIYTITELVRRWKHFFVSFKIGEKESPDLWIFMISYTLCHWSLLEARKAMKRKGNKSLPHENSWRGTSNEKNSYAVIIDFCLF